MTWLLEKWGALGSYSPAGNTANHIRHAILMTKGEIDFRTIYSQTGWRKIDGEWFFLMPQEDSAFTVELQGKLRSYQFSKCCSDDDLIYLTAMLDEGFLPQRLMLPLLAFTFLAPLNNFMRLEKAIRYFCGHLDCNTRCATEYLGAALQNMLDGMIKGSEQRTSRLLFKIAVEVGKLSHITAAVNDVDEEEINKLQSMCIDEVRRLNGIIQFENAYRFQKS